MIPKIDHIQITVKDLKKAEAFYDLLMPILGFDLDKKSKGTVEAHDFEVIEYIHKEITIGFNSPRTAFANDDIHRRKPGALHHLAFKAESCEAVNQVYSKICNIGAHIVNPPQFYPQHGAFYYALFFKDLDGIKLEVVYEKEL
ncbi:MAG: glyoxalase [Bacteroidetes bacterium MedPE-SWsnd-G2]|nr:MAG: glyoxalase [Bacteroidetes bacterium MedPE-SWsnd-G2]